MKKYRKQLCRTAGAVLMGISVKNIYEPTGMVTGGFSGLAILANAGLGIPLWLTNIILNIPLFVITAYFMGKNIVINSLSATLVYSLAVAVMPNMNLLDGDLFLSCVLGGMIMGAGLGLIIYSGGSSGGVDMLSILVHHKNNRIPVAWAMFLVDAVIIIMGGVLFGWVKAIYSVISAWIASFITGKIIDGPDYSKACIIISRKSYEISQRIMREIGRGVTGIDGKGLFSNKKELILFCVSSTHEMTAIREIVFEVDKNAFMTVSNVSEVFGEGFVKK